MSVADDLARNRRVFELLTGASAEQVDSAADGSSSRPLSVPEWERAESARDFVPAESPDGRKFSLAYGVKSGTGSVFDSEAPDSNGFPALRGAVAESLPDPLESLYYQLEIEARMISQISGEEEF